jgi:hypothetical protein
MAVMKVYGRQPKVEAKRTPAFEVKLEVHQAKGLDTHLFDGAYIGSSYVVFACYVEV